VAPALLQLLKGWLASHIKGEDRDYVESVRAVIDSADKEVSSWLNNALKKFFA
jgi:hemerythrin